MPGKFRGDPDEPRYVIRWFRLEERDGEPAWVPMQKFVMLGGVENDNEARAKLEEWKGEDKNPFANAPDVAGPFLYKTERIA